MDMLKRMESRLSEEGRRFLQRVYAPQVVAVPPRDAAKSLCLMPDGEIRIYGVADKKEPDDEGRQVYIASGDCGLSWKTHETPEGALGAAADHADAQAQRREGSRLCNRRRAHGDESCDSRERSAGG